MNIFVPFGYAAELEIWLTQHGVKLDKKFHLKIDGEPYVEIFFQLHFQPGPVPKFDKRKILELRGNGNTYDEIARIVGCSKSYVQKVVRECQKNS